MSQYIQNETTGLWHRLRAKINDDGVLEQFLDPTGITSPFSAESPSAYISDFREPVRAFLGDFDAVIRKYQDSSIDTVIRSLLRCGELAGFTLASDLVSITPDIALPRDYALLTYKACLKFVTPNAAAYGYRTRAMSESFGAQTDVLSELHQSLYSIESGAQFSSFQNLAAWAKSLTGVNIWAHLSDLRTRAPVATVTIGRDGIHVNR